MRVQEMERAGDGETKREYRRDRAEGMRGSIYKA